MNVDFKRLAITNRIARLKSSGKDNYAVIKKLERQLRNLDK
jgi:hypothetical protein